MSKYEEELLDEIEEMKDIIHDLKLDWIAEHKQRVESELDASKTAQELSKQVDKLEQEIELLDTSLEEKQVCIKHWEVRFQGEVKDRERLEDELIKALALLETLNQGNVRFFSTTEGIESLKEAKRRLEMLLKAKTISNK